MNILGGFLLLFGGLISAFALSSWMLELPAGGLALLGGALVAAGWGILIFRS